MIGVVFDRKSGVLGYRRLATKAEEKEMGCNYVIDLLDPVNFKRIETVASSGPTYNWHELPKTDPRVQYMALFDVIEGGIADWYYSGYSEGDGICVDEAFIENAHEVFERIRKIFG